MQMLKNLEIVYAMFIEYAEYVWQINLHMHIQIHTSRGKKS